MIVSRFGMYAIATAAALTHPTAAIEAPQPSDLDSKAIEQAAGSPVTVKDDGVVRIGWSRDDVAVTIDGMPFKPQAGLGSWAAFTALPSGGAMVMGDTVVFEDEITPAMDAAFAHGLHVTALHNHFVFDRPPVYFMHIGGTGDEATLAAGVRAMWDAIKTLRQAHPEPASTFDGKAPEQSGEFDIASLEQVLGGKASINNGVVKFTFGRTASMHNVRFGASMGLATWAAFSGNQADAIVDGDFAMTAPEVQPVMRSLRRSGIHIVALHNHMIGESPPFYFLHYWGKGSAGDLAQGLRTAMEAQAAATAMRALGDGAAFLWRFDDAQPGLLPQGWRSDATHPDGEPSRWYVKIDASAVSGEHVLALGRPLRFQNGTFNLCWTDRVRFRNGELAVKVKARTGEVDQGGGPMWRVQDANNYYIARWNPLEDNLRIYYVKDGRRVQLASADVQVDSTQWHTITIEHAGDEIACSFDGRPTLKVKDATIGAEGGVGVWTKADAASLFDDFAVEIDDRRRPQETGRKQSPPLNLNGTRFISIDKHETGLGPNGPVQGHWHVRFKDGFAQWDYSDVQETGEFTVTQDGTIKANMGPNGLTEGFLDGANNRLFWAGKWYKLDENKKAGC